MNRVSANANFRLLARFIALTAFALFGISRTGSAQTSDVVLQKVSGDKIEGSIEAMDVDSISMVTPKGAKKIAFESVQKITTELQPKQPEENNLAIRLVDGSSLNAKSFSIVDRKLSAKLQNGLDVTIETRNVTWVRFKTYENSLDLGKQWRAILEDKTIEGDVLVVNRSDELNAVEGIVGDYSEDKVEFSIGERTARVAAKKMDAILFYHAAGRELAAPVCKLTLGDDTQLSVRGMSWDEGRIKAKLVCGSEFTAPLESVSEVNFSLGRDELLSSMEPSTNDWQALITSSAILEKLRRLKLATKNESFSGEPLSLKIYPESGQSFLSEIKQFEHGYAMQGGGKLAFSLNGRYEKLTGLVGFDPLASISGHVKFIVLVDGKPLVQKEMIHRTMKNPIELDVDIKDAKRVVFQVEYQDGRSIGDQIHLVNLKVSQ